jgi:hypothetical protein
VFVLAQLKEIPPEFDCRSPGLSKLTLPSLAKQICCICIFAEVSGFTRQIRQITPIAKGSNRPYYKLFLLHGGDREPESLRSVLNRMRDCCVGFSTTPNIGASSRARPVDVSTSRIMKRYAHNPTVVSVNLFFSGCARGNSRRPGRHTLAQPRCQTV